MKYLRALWVGAVVMTAACDKSAPGTDAPGDDRVGGSRRSGPEAAPWLRR